MACVQTPYFWPSNCWEPENTDYAVYHRVPVNEKNLCVFQPCTTVYHRVPVNDQHLYVFQPCTPVYLCKRTMQNKTRLELADYEAENLARLQKMFSRKWEFIFMQAEAQAKWVGETTGEGARGVRPWRCRVDKKRDKLERKVLDSQERAFWDVHRPAPGCVNTTEIDIKKACRMNKPIKSSKCADAFRMLTVAYGEATLDRSNVYRWYKMFSEVREDVNDKERAGRPSTSTTDEKINEVEKMILANRRITVREVAEDLNISIGSCHSIFINDLGMRRVAAKFVQKLLNCEQKQHRINIANEMLDSVRDDPNLLQRVITGAEAWVYGYDVETKAQSSQWKLPHEPRPKKARQVRSNVKVLLTVFFDCRGVVHHEFLSQGRTVNKEYYLQVMRNLREAIRQKRPDLWKNKNWLLHHDNAPAHTSLLVRDFLAKNNTLMMPQPPYSPDLPPCDFFLFPKLKRPMKGRRYATLDEIKTASKEELRKNQKNDFLKCFEDWKNRWHKCIISHGDYFEGDKIAVSHIKHSFLELSFNLNCSFSPPKLCPLGYQHMQCSVSGGRLSPSVSEADLSNPAEALMLELETLRNQIERSNVKISKVADSYLAYFDQYQEYDPFIVVPEPSNPWVSDSVEFWEMEKQTVEFWEMEKQIVEFWEMEKQTVEFWEMEKQTVEFWEMEKQTVEFWEMEKQTKDVPPRRVKRWAFSLKELLRDPAGREQFFKFLEKEFSAENLKFWDAVQELKQVHSKEVPNKVKEIWNEFLASDSNSPVNIDSKSYELTKKNMESPNRWIFDEAAVHLYQLMKNDSYPRYLRSEMYKEYVNGIKKKTSVKGIRSVISFSGKKDQGTS
ncbi:RGS7 [Cordylochernes scorpioides]|uniref:RGS7 n=1 Tax=Cordylochernes scorpioides TaxID=51811 RepID=A0ABY6KS48_9ARAC|nr:RGS7 [Cordylochernes scorpioides]